jgi:hypothetical protein
MAALGADLPRLSLEIDALLLRENQEVLIGKKS